MEEKYKDTSLGDFIAEQFQPAECEYKKRKIAEIICPVTGLCPGETCFYHHTYCPYYMADSILSMLSEDKQPTPPVEVSGMLSPEQIKALRQGIAQVLWEADRSDAPQTQVPFIPQLGLGMPINTIHYGFLADRVIEFLQGQ